MDKAATKVIGASQIILMQELRCSGYYLILYYEHALFIFSCWYISCPFALAKSIRCTLFSSSVCNLEFWGHFTLYFCFLITFMFILLLPSSYLALVTKKVSILRSHKISGN